MLDGADANAKACTELLEKKRRTVVLRFALYYTLLRSRP
jgi:hypothetical protein